MDSLCFLYLDICYLFQVWDIFIHNVIKYIFNSFLFSFWDPYNVNVSTVIVVSESP